MPLVCRIELDKTKGIVITVLNEEGKITQTVEMNGTDIITTAKGEKETSTITQNPEFITIKCKTYTVEAETITCKSTLATLHQSQDTMQIKSVKDMTIHTDAKLTESATKDVEVSGDNITATATKTAKMAGKDATVDAAMGKATVTGKDLSLVAKVGAEMEGVNIAATAKAKLDLVGKLTTLEGTATTIKGSIVKVG